jgi:hypothetical protein
MQFIIFLSLATHRGCLHLQPINVSSRLCLPKIQRYIQRFSASAGGSTFHVVKHLAVAT